MSITDTSAPTQPDNAELRAIDHNGFTPGAYPAEPTNADLLRQLDEIHDAIQRQLDESNARARLVLVNSMSADEMRIALRYIAGHAPEVFSAAAALIVEFGPEGARSIPAACPADNRLAAQLAAAIDDVTAWGAR